MIYAFDDGMVMALENPREKNSESRHNPTRKGLSGIRAPRVTGFYSWQHLILNDIT
jgi:hypothetical protein